MPRSESAVSEADNCYADVIVPRHLTKSFTYRVPVSLRPKIHVGRIVRVPFGRSVLEGAVVSLRETVPREVGSAFLKDIQGLGDDGETWPAELFSLSRKVAERYVAPWGQCLRLILPPALHRPPTAVRYRLNERGRAALHAQAACPLEAQAILAHLRARAAGLSMSTLKRKHGEALCRSLAILRRRGWIEEVVATSLRPSRRRSDRAASNMLPGMPTALPDPSWPEPDKRCQTRLQDALEGNRHARAIVEGSPKERLGLLDWAIGSVEKSGKRVLIIVGEAEKAQWIACHLRARGHTAVAEFHAGLSERDKADQWREINKGTAPVVVGTRSAVFAPLRTIGLIWVDGEESASLKEPQEPRYHARVVAEMRAAEHQALLVLASDHVSLESLSEAGGRVLCLGRATGARPAVDVVDLRREDSGFMLSAPLRETMRQVLTNRGGIVLFLNRKGYAGALACRECGEVPRCNRCSVALVFHRSNGRLICHYCGYDIAAPETCPACLAPRLHPLGGGTEKVEEEARRFFPEARVCRLDRDALKSPAQVRAAWERLEAGEWDIVIGTQLLFQRPFSVAAGLVAVVQADAGLSVPDFRSAERTYHSLLNAAAMARPAEMGGRVIIQALLPNHYAIQAAATRDPDLFYKSERGVRDSLGYPPASELAVLHVSGRHEEAVASAARRWAGRLATLIPSGEGGFATAAGIAVVGPAPAPIRRLRGRFRWQLLLKAKGLNPVLDPLKRSVEEMERSYGNAGLRFDVDVDPVDLA